MLMLSNFVFLQIFHLKGNSDSFQYVNTKVTGDLNFTVLIERDDWSAAGIMCKYKYCLFNFLSYLNHGETDFLFPSISQLLNTKFEILWMMTQGNILY